MRADNRFRSEPHAGLYQLLEELNWIEDLLEDMAALGIYNRAEAEARMHQLNTMLDEQEGHGLAQQPDDGALRQ